MAIESEVTEVRKETNVPTERNHGVSKVAQIVWFITGVIVAVLGLRIVLAMIGANLANPFASFIYSLTDPFVSPFRGLLQIGEFQAGVARFELETLIAAIIYLLIGWGIVSAVRLAK